MHLVPTTLAPGIREKRPRYFEVRVYGGLDPLIDHLGVLGREPTTLPSYRTIARWLGGATAVALTRSAAATSTRT